jgi:hypothetical protein
VELVEVGQVELQVVTVLALLEQQTLEVAQVVVLVQVVEVQEEVHLVVQE